MVNRIRATPVSDVVTRCENHETCGGMAFTYNPNDGPGVDGTYALERCNECKKPDDLARPCSGKCGRESWNARYQYCLICKEYTCNSGKSCDKQRLTYENSTTGATSCRECGRECRSANTKRKTAEETSVVTQAGRKRSKSGRLKDEPLNYRQIELVVKVVCEYRDEIGDATSRLSWVEVTKRLRARDDFPSTITEKGIKNAWNRLSGKPASVAAYENSEEYETNRDNRDW